MISKNNYLRIPVAAALTGAVLLVVAFSMAAFAAVRLRARTSTVNLAAANGASAVVFTAKKSNKPEFDFYVMSFCPYGNQAEEALKPVADLLGSQALIQPHYIFQKIGNIADYCKQSVPDSANCGQYIKSSQVPFEKTITACKAYIENMSKTCLDEKQYLKTSDGSYYASLHGRQEANEDVREICAWNQTTDKKQWWNFVENVNKNCTAQNADSCWEDQAKKAGYDTAKITECFNNEAVTLIEKEIALTSQNKIQGSPTFLMAGAAFPPDSAYTQDGKGSLKIGKTVFAQDQYRTPNAIKEAICASFNKAPKECATKLAAPTAQAPAAGGCGQ